MKKTFTVIIVSMVILATGVTTLQAQGKNQAEEPIIARTLCAIGGAAGGVLLGWRVVDDDSLNAERNVALSMAILGLGGAVGGYFIGRELDRSRSSYSYQLDDFQKRQLIVEWAQTEGHQISEELTEASLQPSQLATTSKTSK